MSSASMSSLILFIAAMLIAAGVAGTLVTNVNDISSSIDTHSGDVREKIDTDIEIISDPGSDQRIDDQIITLYVKNTGEGSLSSEPGGFDVLVNGRYISSADLSISILDGDSWRSGGVVELEIDAEVPFDENSEHRITVTVNGDREEYEFYHG